MEICIPAQGVFMARMYPDPIPKDVLDNPCLSTEVMFYKTIKDGLPADWVGFFRRHWLLKRRKGGAKDGENEFVLAHHFHGILIIEVKGGQIAYDGGSDQFTSMDRKGKVHKIKNPFQQVGYSMHSWRRKIKEQRGCATFSPHIARAVCFPHCSTSPDFHNPEFYPDMVILRGDLNNIERKITSICNFWRRRDTHDQNLGTHGVKLITKILASSWQLPSPLTFEIEDSNREILKLTEQQFHILYNILARNRRAAAFGGAGTGKTVLALERAKRLADEGFEVLLTCFNRELALHLQQCTSGTENLEIYTFPQLCRYFGMESGILRNVSLPSEDAFNDEAAFHEKLPSILLDSIARFDKRYDAIVIDEAQDFHSDWLTSLEMCLRDSNDGLFYIFYDDNQNIYRRPSDMPTSLPEIPLTVNFRNTKRIHSISNRYYRGSETLPIGPIGTDVEIIEVPSPEIIPEATKSVLTRLVGEDRIDPREIAVLSPKDHGASSVFQFIRQNVKSVSSGIEVKVLNIFIQSIRLFKGLERKVVILTEIEDISPEEENTNLYIGTSRARNHLIVIATRKTLMRFGFH
jgi:hypothetical protein